MADVGSEALRATIRRRADQRRAELERLRAEVAEHHEDQAALRGELADAWAELSAELLPALEAPLLGALADDLAEPRLRPSAIEAAIAAERGALDQSLAELDAERLRRGDEGDLDAQLRALEAAMAPHAANLERFDQEPAWAELFDHEYGTPLYPLKWWMFRYYRHWRSADAVVAALGPHFGVEDFAGLRRRFLEERAAREALARHWEVATARKAGFENLDRGRRSALAAVAELDARHLARARRIIRERLRSGVPEALHARLEGLAARLRRLAAIEAKSELLAASFTAWVQRPLDQLRDQLDADERELVALTAGHERAMAWEDFVDTHADPQPSWEARRAGYQAARRRLLEFRAYDDLDPEADLWAAIVGDAAPRPGEP